MKLNLFSKLLWIILLTVTVNSFIYFSFGNIYSSKILNYSGFSQQFHSGIYQYRILSGYFLLCIYDFLSTCNIDYRIYKLKFLDPRSEPQMYLSFYILNTFFMVLSAAAILLITETKNFAATVTEKFLIVTVAVFTMALGQFVLVPYDLSSYFFLLLFYYLVLGYLEKKSALKLFFMMILILISTLNRESSALSVSLAATLLYSKFGWRKDTYQPVALLGLVFIAAYLGMRFLSSSFGTNDGNLLIENLSDPKNILGAFFWLCFFVFSLIISKNRNTRHQILIFHFLSLPYIAMCFYTGIIYEIRLYIPVFLTALLLGRTEFSRIH